MMKDPKRWRDPSSGADPQVRSLLVNDCGTLPSNAEVERIWSGLASGLPLAAGPVAAPQAGAVAAAAGKGALGAKLTLAIVLVVGAAAGIGLHSRSSHDARKAELRGEAAQRMQSEASPAPSGRGAAPSPRAAAIPAAAAAQEIRLGQEKAPRARSVARAPQPPLPAVAIPAAEALPRKLDKRPFSSRRGTAERSAPAVPELRPRATGYAESPASPALPEMHLQATAEAASPAVPQMHPQAIAQAESPAVSVNELLEESRRLDRVRTALRARHPDRALQLLKLDAPENSPLAQEREALTIEAQAAKPSLRAVATERARAFLRTYPQSPYRARIRAIIVESE